MTGTGQRKCHRGLLFSGGAFFVYKVGGRLKRVRNILRGEQEKVNKKRAS
jgi:hypothetical protein